MALFELRTYIIKHGCRDKWVELMDELVIPFQVGMGMTVIGSFTDLENEDQYIWIRRFNDENQRKNLYDAVYGSDTWKTKIKQAMGDMLIREKVQVRLIRPTPSSPIQ